MSKRVQRAQEDPAHGGYFVVYDMRNSRCHQDYDVRGYDAAGNLLLHTWHVGETSMKMECDAWRERGATERILTSTP